jgi:SAM-dependent methyltransferase
VEVNEEATGISRKQGHMVWSGELCEVGLPQQFFDVVYLSHVLEHVRSPRAALRQLRCSVRPDAYIIITVPNFDSPWSNIFGEYDWNLDLPRHFYHFGKSTLKRLVLDAGFEVVKWRTIATGNYFLSSFAVSSRARLGTDCPRVGRDGTEDFIGNMEMKESLRPFCRQLERNGLGNQIRLVCVAK